MDTNTPASITYSLEHLSDADLHVSTRRLIGRSNQLLAALLAHLAEVEARGTRQFPVLFEQVAAGEIHLTGILLLGPHLTEENHRELLARAKHRTKKEIVRLVRKINPLPNVPAIVEPLGPGPRAVIANPTWSQRVEAHSPEVRELEPGDRPRDWMDESPLEPPVEYAGARNERTGVDSKPEPAPPDPLEPQRYKVQFTATQEYVDLLEEARDLLAHAVPSRSIEEVHLRAMRVLVAELKNKKTGAINEPRPTALAPPTSAGVPGTRGNPANPRQRGTRDDASPRQRGVHDPMNPRQRGRSIPRAVRRAVWERDGSRCTYVDATGQRCRETGGLELDHVEAHARGGRSTVENLACGVARTTR